MTPRTTARAADAQGRPWTKRCKCCGKRKGADAFLRAPRERDGLMRSCARCVGGGDGIRARLEFNAPLELGARDPLRGFALDQKGKLK
jgi:hypothetical protein